MYCRAGSSPRSLPIECVIQALEREQEHAFVHGLTRWHAWQVWIHGGRVKVVPLPSTPAELITIPSRPTLDDALELLFSHNECVANALPRVHEAIINKISHLEASTDSHHHEARCLLPLLVANVIAERPGVVAAAVRAFYYRDPDALRACSRMERFAPKDGTMVLASVRFSRCMYGQLRMQHFVAPRKRGTAEDLFPALDTRHPDFKAAELGMKLVRCSAGVCSLSLVVHTN